MGGILKERDIQLDNYRALAMMYVLCITHTLFWFSIGTDLVISILLIEMPVIFFISGASLSIAEKKSFLRTLLNRFKRVLVPYYVYSIVLLFFISILSCLLFFFRSEFISILGSDIVNLYSYDILAYKWHDVYNILFFKEIPQSHFTSHLWFILPYMVLTCSFGLQIRLMLFVNRWVYIALCLFVFFLSDVFDFNEDIVTILAYNIFLVAGYLFYKKVRTWQLIIIGGLSFVFVFVYVENGGFFVPMQVHKFPPDIIFVIYNLGAICSLSLIIGRCKIRKNKIMDIWNQRGYTIYLYQSIIFSVIYPFYYLCVRNIDYLSVQWLICALLIFVLSTILCMVTYPVERLFVTMTGINKSS